MSRPLYNCISVVKCMCQRAYKPIPMAIYVCGLICAHIYVVVYGGQGPMI